MTRKAQTRLMVLNRILDGQLTAAEAAALLSLSERQVRRLLAAYREDGAAALIHGNRGRSPAHTLDPALRQQILDLATTRYAGCNDRHLAELLAERERLCVSRSTVRRLLREAGIASPRTRRPPKHRQRRERKPQEGMLLQLDGSRHAWLGQRGPRLTLLAAIDDATGTVPAALFREQEDAHGYVLLLRHIVTTVGCPLAVYHDRHSIFRPVNQQETLEEHLAGERQPTQVGRLLADLGIAAIAAQSPQAKGRVERLFGTLQDRLVAELRLAEIATLAAANQFLQAFLPRFNAQFAVPPAQAGTAYRPLDPELDLEQVCCFIYQRTVAADNTVPFGTQRLQLQPDRVRASYARCHVEVHERLDGSLAVYYQGRCLATRPAPLEAPVLRTRPGRGRPAVEAATAAPPPAAVAAVPPKPPAPAPPARRPAPDHPWRTPRRAAMS